MRTYVCEECGRKRQSTKKEKRSALSKMYVYGGPIQCLLYYSWDEKVD